jgi:hypothetical protein
MNQDEDEICQHKRNNYRGRIDSRDHDLGEEVQR